MFALAPLLMRLMGARPEAAGLGSDYLRAASLGFPMLMVLYAVSGSLRGMGNTWLPMLILIVVNAANAVVTLLLITGHPLDLGVRAAGIGYATAGTLGGLLALVAAAAGPLPVRLDAGRLAAVSRVAAARVLRVGLPVGLEEAQFLLAFLVYTRIIATLGTDQLAAHALALRAQEVSILPGFALGTVATALVGRSLGAGDTATAELVAKRVRFFAICTLSVMAAVQFTFAPQIVRLFVDKPEVVHRGTTLLRVFSFGLPMLGVHSSVSGALRGAGDVRYVLATLTATAWGVRVPLAAFLVLGLGLSVSFAWLAAVTENVVRAILILRRFRQGAWKTLRV